MYRPKEELEDLTERIKSDTDLDLDSSKRIMKKNLLELLNGIVTGKIDDEKDARKEYLVKIFDYKDALKRSRNF